MSFAESFGIQTWKGVTSGRVEKVLATHNRVHANGLINHGYSVVELVHVPVGLYRTNMADRS